MDTVVNINLDTFQPLLNQLIASNLVHPYMELLKDGKSEEEARNTVTLLWAQMVIVVESTIEEANRHRQAMGKKQS